MSASNSWKRVARWDKRKMAGWSLKHEQMIRLLTKPSLSAFQYAFPRIHEKRASEGTWPGSMKISRYLYKSYLRSKESKKPVMLLCAFIRLKLFCLRNFPLRKGSILSRPWVVFLLLLVCKIRSLWNDFYTCTIFMHNTFSIAKHVSNCVLWLSSNLWIHLIPLNGFR